MARRLVDILLPDSSKLSTTSVPLPFMWFFNDINISIHSDAYSTYTAWILIPDTPHILIIFVTSSDYLALAPRAVAQYIYSPSFFTVHIL
jgi:hypothetical protein